MQNSAQTITARSMQENSRGDRDFGSSDQEATGSRSNEPLDSGEQQR